MSEELVVPDLVEPIIGWRCWSVKLDPQSGSPYLSSVTALRSIYPGNYWPKKEALVAQCLRSVGLGPEDPCGESPNRLCSCGIYAFAKFNPELAAVPPRTTRYGVHIGPGFCTQVMGRVALWGKVIRHERGYRAEKAYPVTLAVKGQLHPSIDREGLFEDLLDAYGCRLDEHGRPIQLRLDL